MVKQPNNALMRKYTREGLSLLALHHMEMGELADSSAEALEELVELQRKRSALRAAGIVFDQEREKKLKQQAAEVQEKLISYCKFIGWEIIIRIIYSIYNYKTSGAFCVKIY